MPTLLPSHTFCVAPMVDWTDRHCRYFLRLLSKHARLYTEMITTGAILYGNVERQLSFHPLEHPVALQLGGNDPKALENCARIAAEFGYDEINFNVGCPSSRVKSGRFGACLMAEPKLVADCVAAMHGAAGLPVTVKTRIGIDYQDTYDALCHFIDTVAQRGCEIFIIHARKAWLNGLSPKENREIPPLRYEVVKRLTEDFPQYYFILNGGITTLEQAQMQLSTFSGVMVGRGIMHHPYLLAMVDQLFFHEEQEQPTREQVLAAYCAYAQKQLALGIPRSILIRPLMGLYRGLAGAKQWRCRLNKQNELIFP